MERRTFIRTLTGGLLAAPLGAAAQPAGRVYRLGLLYPIAPGPSEHRTAAVLIPAALRELGYVEGQNLVVERRDADGQVDRFPSGTRPGRFRSSSTATLIRSRPNSWRTSRAPEATSPG